MGNEIPKLDYEQKFWSQGYDFVIGVDEAGRGPLAGPVVASAVLLLKQKSKFTNPALQGDLENFNELLKLDVKDSKKLSAKKREKIFEELKKSEFIKYGVGIVDEKTIDKINILQASLLAMKKALESLYKGPTFVNHVNYEGRSFVIVDGREVVPDISMSQKAIIGGDGKVFSIAAASIIAKVTRDKIMEEYDKKYPEYLFAKHKGYGTKLHFEMIKKFGSCPIHRNTFL